MKIPSASPLNHGWIAICSENLKDFISKFWIKSGVNIKPRRYL